MSSLKGVTVPSLGNLAEEFSFIRNSSFLEVPGVIVFDSGIPGPCLGITIQTHGNEPSGLAALRHFRQENLVRSLLKGSVVFVLNNIDAAKRYFETFSITDVAVLTRAKLETRFCLPDGVNMNRLPANTLELLSDARPEIVRAQKLAPIWKKFDVGLDIHTTKSPMAPIVIAIGTVGENLYRGFPIDVIYRNIENVQKNKPAVAFYGQPGITPVFGIEAGLHEEESSFGTAIVCVLGLLQNLGMLAGESSATKRLYAEYFINNSVFFPDKSYKLSKKFEPYEIISAGQILAEGDGAPITAKSDGHVILPPPGREPTAALSDEVMFLSMPVRMVEA
jgi:hypothetical protein